MGNLLQGPARVLAPSPPPSAFAPMHRFPGFVATSAQLLKEVHHRRAVGAAASHRVHGCCNTRTFSSKKRPLGALSPEASRALPNPPRHPSHPHHPESNNCCDGDGDGDGDDDAVAQATLRWVRSTVVGLNLCPWAGGALIGGRMQVIVHPPTCRPLPPPPAEAASGGASDGDTVGDGDGGERDSGGYGRGEERSGLLEGLVQVAARQAAALGGLEGEAAVNATTLVVARPPVAQDFEEFLGVVGAVDDFLDDSGLRGTVQLATFHPQYQFEGSDEDDASNYTNRSPYPVLHLLLEDQVSAAVAQVGDPEKVWQRNVETTRKLGVEAMRQGVEACLQEGGAREDRR